MTDKELIVELEAQRSLMIVVSTGGLRIQEVNDEYRERRERIKVGLAERGLQDPNPYSDLWRWYGKWKDGSLPSYQSRRQYIAELLDPLIDRVREGPRQAGAELFGEPTGWARVDRGIDAVRGRLETAGNEEEFQTVGLLCRETLISLAQSVFDSELHGMVNGIRPSNTDAKKMLEAYVSRELAGGANEEFRRHAKAALDLANSLQHKRTPKFRDAALCAEATNAVVNLIAIISGRRDPEE
jgi:hypothetical protein